MTEIPEWFRQRRYLHFDQPLSWQRVEKIATNSHTVARHAFYPLIRYTIKTEKLFFDKSIGKLAHAPKERQISYAAHLDSHIYAYYTTLLSERYEQHLKEAGIQDCVMAFRRLGVSNVDIAKLAFDRIRSKRKCVAVAMDISGFFDHLDHAILKAQWATILGSPTLPDDHFNVFRSVTRFSWVERTPLYDAFSISPHNPKAGRVKVCDPLQFRTIVRPKGLINSNTQSFGIPQGTAISALLSNIYMFEFDKTINAVVARVNGWYVRYCDDILIIVPPYCAKQIEARLVKEIARLKLTINPKKTERSEFRLLGKSLQANRPLQYLGFTFNGNQILIRSAALARYSQRMKSAVRRAKATAKSRNSEKIIRGSEPKDIYTKSLLNRYAHVGRRNFVTYGYKAAKKLESNAIRKQLRPLWERLRKEIEK